MRVKEGIASLIFPGEGREQERSEWMDEHGWLVVLPEG